MEKVYTITKHYSNDYSDDIETYVAKSYDEAKAMALKMRDEFKEEIGGDVEDYNEEMCGDNFTFLVAWSDVSCLNLELYINEHTL